MIFLRAPKASGADWFTSPSGSPAGSGTFASPWDLQTALAGGVANAIQPGDRLWALGGTYPGLFASSLAGSAGAQIIARNMPGQRVTIDGYLHTTLTGSMTNVQTSVPMAKLSVPDGQVINIGTESIRLHSYSAGAYNGVDRGWDGTTAVTHSNGDGVDTDNGHCMTVGGQYSSLIGFEATVSTSRYTNRVNPQAGSNPFGRPPSGFELNGNWNKVINCIAHDTTDGFSTSAGAADNFEFHGCQAQYIGWDASDRGHGHGYYIHNDNPGTSLALVGACIVLASFDFNAQIFTGGTSLGNVQLDGFMASQAGIISAFGPVTELLMGFSPGPIIGSSLTRSAIYANGLNGFGVSWGYSGGGTDGCTLTGNYVAAQNTAIALSGASTNLTTSGNTWVGPSSAPNPASGTFLSWKPGSGKAFIVSTNLYEAGRANIAVFNWDASASVNLDFSSFLNNGDTYVVRNAWNYFGTPVASGTYSGSPVSVAAQGLTIAAPVGLSAPSETGPEFNVYVVSKT